MIITQKQYLYIGESTAYNAETTAVYIMLKAPNKMPFDHYNPAMALAFHKRRPKMKDDHIFTLPICLMPDRAAPRLKFTGTIMQCAK